MPTALIYDRDSEDLLGTVDVINGSAVIKSDNPHIRKWLRDTVVLDERGVVPLREGNRYVQAMAQFQFVSVVE